MANNRSIVEYFYHDEDDSSGRRCGYCKSSDTNISKGMWGHIITCQDYQDLIDRGWRRSGKYIYKPTMKKTCCPPYTIRCDALTFKPSKSHKKVLKHVTKYLKTDHKNVKTDKEEPEPSSTTGSTSIDDDKLMKSNEPKAEATKRGPRKSAGPDPNKPPCRKAKLIRKEKWLEKQAAKPKMETLKTTNENEGKTLEEFMSDHLPSTEAVHKLECVLMRCDPDLPEFQQSYEKSFKLFCKYQKEIHKDKPDKLNEGRFKRFLVDSPLIFEKNAASPSTGWGSFHQHYYLDAKLIAVAVLDILPDCVSSVYLYYDTDYSFLSLGVYSALRELHFTQELNKTSSALKYYYMGYYIHSCTKMKYKGKYNPSYLACPESFSWIPVEKCQPKLDANKYSRLDETDKEDPEVDVNKTLILLNRRGLMMYSLYKAYRGSNDLAEVKEYSQLVGPKVASRMSLFRS